MTTMTNLTTAVTGGVDTHGQMHHAAVLDHVAASWVIVNSRRRQMVTVRC